jgi:hypothetical protein
MKEATKQLGIRIPASQYLGLKTIALNKDISLTDLVISIFGSYLDASIPGLCPKCYMQNAPDAKFCSQCSAPLSSDSIQLSTQINITPKISASIQAFEDLDALTNYILKARQEVGEVDKRLESLEKLKAEIESRMKKN